MTDLFVANRYVFQIFIDDDQFLRSKFHFEQLNKNIKCYLSSFVNKTASICLPWLLYVLNQYFKINLE